MSDTGEHGSESHTAAESWRPGTDWFVEDNPVESFGSTVERALRQLSVELAGIRAERDGLRLELEGLRAQYELVRQQLADRDRFGAAVSELTDIVRNLTLPPGWAQQPASPAPQPATAPPAPAVAPTFPTAPPPVAVAPEPAAAAPVAAIPEPPAASPAPPASAPVTPAATPAPQAAPAIPSPIVLPGEPPAAPTFVAPPPPEPAAAAEIPVAPSPIVWPDEPDVAAFAPAPEPPDSAFAPPAVPDELPPHTAPEPPAPSRARRTMPEPPPLSDDTAADDGSGSDRPRAAQVERFFEGPGIWLDEPADHERHVSSLSRWGSRLGIVALGLFVATVLFVSVGPRFLPYQTYFVRSGSMEPTIETGAMILLTKVDAEDLDVGDIISFKRPDKPDTIVTHRIHAIEANESGRAFVTKGDANGTPDVWRVPATGSGWRYAAGVPKVGFVVGYLGTPIARLALLAIPAGILGVLSLLDIWKPAKSSRARRGR